jgi:phenylacetic acid degradation operon negative regulatory protein
MTFFGAFLRRLGGWIAVADLIALMAELGLDAQAVRSSVSRLKRRGVIESERRGGAAGYRLTERGEAILRAGDARIYGRAGSRDAAATRDDAARRPAAIRDDGAHRPAWLLVVFSIPEAQRAVRHRLRAGLTGLGLGTVAPAVWIAPAHLRTEVERLVAELGVSDRVELFAADPLTDPARYWDLDALAAEYSRYLAEWESRPVDGFADYIRHLDAWRRIPFHDPGLPTPVGERAWRVFAGLDARLAPAAWAQVTARVG